MRLEVTAVCWSLTNLPRLNTCYIVRVDTRGTDSSLSMACEHWPSVRADRVEIPVQRMRNRSRHALEETILTGVFHEQTKGRRC